MSGCVREAKEEELAEIREKRPKRLEASSAREIKAGEDLERRSGSQGFKAIQSLSWLWAKELAVCITAMRGTQTVRS